MFQKTEKQKEAIELLVGKAKNIALFGGSRSGKTFILMFAIVVRALKMRSRHAVFRYHFNDVKTSICLDTFPKMMSLVFPSLAPRIKLDKTDWYAKFPNGSEIWFCGLDDKERAEKVLGKEYSTVWFNEASQIDFNSTTKALTRLAEKNGLAKKAYYDFNPPGRGHWTYKLFVEYRNPKDNTKINRDNYVSMLMNPKDNLDNLDEEYLDRLGELPEDERARFLHGLWGEGVEGAVYGKELRMSDANNRFGDFKYNPQYPVYTAWDLGVSDKTAIWFAQFIEDKIYLIDYYENQFYGVDHYATILKEKPYEYGRHFLPFDAKNKSWSTGRTRREVVEEKLGNNVDVLPQLGLLDGIHNVRVLFSNMYFDNTNCSAGIECIRNYRYEFDSQNGVYKKSPQHDWSSHGADALRYLCTAYDKMLIPSKKVEEKRPEGWIFQDLLDDSRKARLSMNRNRL